MNDLREIASAISLRDHFVLVGHANPDGDCIGSLLGLYLGLRSSGKQVEVLLADEVPSIYHYLKGAESINVPDELFHRWENVIFLDCSDFERSGETVMDRVREVSFSINIDHHASNHGFADLNYVDPSAAATAEIVFDLLKTMQIPIQADMANAFYAGLVQDTGNFRHSNTGSKSFRNAAELVDLGANIEMMKLNLFESKSKTEVLILAKALSSLCFTEDDSIAWMTLSKQDIHSLEAGDFFPEGIINYTLLAKSVKVGLLFRELEDESVKVGFRSKGTVNVGKLAEQFGGGGHPQASGVHLQGPLHQVKDLIIEAVKEVIA